jgi:hypothetical protein
MSDKEKCVFEKGVQHIRRLKDRCSKPSIPLKLESKNTSKNTNSTKAIE